MPYTDLKCRILEEELRTFWPGWRVVRQISEGSFADVFEIRKKEFGVEFASALKVIRYKNREIELQTAEILDPVENSSDEDRAVDIHQHFSPGDSVGKKFTDMTQYHPDDDTMPEVFRNEIRILEQLRGAPNVVNMEGLYYRKDVHEHVLYIRMELLMSIQDLIQTKREFSIQEIIRIGKDVCSALACCEERHIIHRDIKPGNLFLDKYGTCKVGDFGVSRKMDTVHLAHTMTGIGTISYMAPEIYKRRPYNNTVDIYALGLVLYQLLNRGRMPFMPSFPEDYTTADIDESNYLRLHGREIPSLLDTKGNLRKQKNAEKIDAVIRRACAFRPKERYQTAKEMDEALEKCIIRSRENAYVNSADQKNNEAGTDASTFVRKKTEKSAKTPDKERPRRNKNNETKKHNSSLHDFMNDVDRRLDDKLTEISRKQQDSKKKYFQERRHSRKQALLKAGLLILILNLMFVLFFVWYSYQIDMEEWEKVIAASRNGSYVEKYDIGDTIPLHLGREGTVTMVLVAIDADELADGSGKAHMTWVSNDLLRTSKRMNPQYQEGIEGTGAQGGWRESEMRSYLSESVQSHLPEKLQNALQDVNKYSLTYDSETGEYEDQMTVDVIWTPSAREVFADAGCEKTGVSLYRAFEDAIYLETERSGTTDISWWWLRSSFGTSGFYRVNNGSYDGKAKISASSADTEGGVVIGFCL